MHGQWKKWLAGMAFSGFVGLGLLGAPLQGQVDDPVPADVTSAAESHVDTGTPVAESPTMDAGLGTPTTLGAVRHGGLLLNTAVQGVYLPAPTLETDVSLTVRGMVAEADVRQRFTNPTDQWVEGIYVFPLPENAAVDRLRMVIGDRVIEGEIHERQEARRVYEQAREQGQRAALVEQQRPNLFTTDVANLGPHETIEIRIGFRQEVRYTDGTFGLRMPLAVTPRFQPGGTPRSPVELAGGPTTQLPPQATGSTNATGGAPPASAALTAPRAPSVRPPSVQLRLSLEPGLPLARLGSVSHAVHTTRRGDHYEVTLEDGAVPADRDFVFEWQPEAQAEPQIALLTEAGDHDTFGLLMLVPPETQQASGPRPPRETIFVIDVSGSMSGPSIAQAKAALDDALSRLRPIDHVNVISFAQDMQKLFAESLPATQDRVAQARRWVANLGIRGGTYMLPALEAALETDGVDRGLRQVIFMTDGAVGNEDQLFSVIDHMLGDTRLFPVGIGSAPNSHFMRTAARLGRGTFTHIGSVQAVAQRMGALYRKLEQPVLTDLEIIWDDPNVESWPARVGDLYAGEPLTIAARMPSGQSGLTLRGRRAGVPIERRFDATGRAPAIDASRPETPQAVARLWARRKVASLRDDLVRGGDRTSLRQSIIDVALAHHLVTDFTSLVAVDRTPVAPAGTEPVPQAVPLPLPAGWQEHPGFTHLPRTATPFQAWLLLGMLLAASAWLVRRGDRAVASASHDRPSTQTSRAGG